MIDIKALLKQATRLQTTEAVCLRGDLAGQREQLQRQLGKLPKSDKLGGDPERQRIQAEIDRLTDEMKAGTVDFVLRALSQPQFQQLIDAHPPRRDGDDVNARDAEAGFDRSAFYGPLIRACVVEPGLDAEDWDLLFGEGLSPGEFYRLGRAALQVNGQEVDVPFSSDDSSESPD